MAGHISSLRWPPPTQGWSPTNLRMVTNQKEVYYRLWILKLHITHKTNTRWQLPWMVTYHSCEGHPQTQGWSPTNPRMVIPFGPAWPYLTPFGLGCPCLAPLGPVWPRSSAARIVLNCVELNIFMIWDGCALNHFVIYYFDEKYQCLMISFKLILFQQKQEQ